MMFFCSEFCFSASQNIQIWLFKESDPSWRWKQHTSVPVGALSLALFWCFDGRADVSGLRQYPSYECWVLPSPPPPIPPPQQEARTAVGRVSFSVVRKGGLRGARALINGAEWCQARLKRWIKGGVKERVENGETDERRTKRREEGWMSWDGWVTWLLSE